MTKQTYQAGTLMNNKQRTAKFNASATQSVCARSYPWLNGYRAAFFQNLDDAGGWLIAIDSTGPASNKTYAFEIDQALVDRADAVEFDTSNDAAYSRALLDLSNAFRATLKQDK